MPINLHTTAMFKDRDGKQQYASALTSKIRSIANAATTVFMLFAAGYIFDINPPRIAILPTGSHENVPYSYDRAIPACQNGWVVPQMPPSIQAVVEETTADWYDGLPGLLRRTFNKNLGKDPTGWDRFDVMMPAIPQACPMMKRIGEDGDGGKFICGLDQIPDDPQKPCIVYSVGSNNLWGFEADIVSSTTCRVFTFDCTVDGKVPANLHDRVSFHPICLGKSQQDNDPKFMSLKKIMELLGHDHITLLKADIEGYEFDLFHQLLINDGIELPEQIAFEMHYRTQMDGLDWYGREITSGEIALFARDLYEAGYRVISREDNQRCVHCVEFTVVRFRCPLGPRTALNRVRATKDVASPPILRIEQ